MLLKYSITTQILCILCMTRAIMHLFCYRCMLHYTCGNPVSYTHLDVYKRQSLLFVLLQYTIKYMTVHRIKTGYTRTLPVSYFHTSKCWGSQSLQESCNSINSALKTLFSLYMLPAKYVIQAFYRIPRHFIQCLEFLGKVYNLSLIHI